MKVYIASSWRNEQQPEVVEALRAAGHDVYDFRNPRIGEHGFAWSQIDPDWEKWTPREYRDALNHPVARDGYKSDIDALIWADAVVMVQPCGRSSALELGYACGAGKPTVVLLAPGEPELMLSMAWALCLTVEGVVEQLTLLGEQE